MRTESLRTSENNYTQTPKQNIRNKLHMRHTTTIASTKNENNLTGAL